MMVSFSSSSRAARTPGQQPPIGGICGTANRSAFLRIAIQLPWPDGRWLTWDTYGVDLRVAGRASEEPVAMFRPGHEFELAEFSPDGRYVLLIAVDACQVYDAATGRLCAALPNAVAVVPPGADRLTAVNRTSWEQETWDLKTGERLSSHPLATDNRNLLLDVWRAAAINSLVLNWMSPPSMTDFFYRIPYFNRLLSAPISEVQTIRGADGAMSDRRRSRSRSAVTWRPTCSRCWSRHPDKKS